VQSTMLNAWSDHCRAITRPRQKSCVVMPMIATMPVARAYRALPDQSTTGWKAPSSPRYRLPACR
jgi:hypothetical protein